MGALFSRLKSLPVDKKILLLSELAIAGLCIYRYFDYRITGFFVSDEYGYYSYAINGGIYAGRWFFGWFNIFLFRILGVNNVDSFSLLLPFYLFLWSGLTLLLVDRILILLKFDGKAVALSLLSSFALISFVLLSLGFLTEPMGLALAMGGIYCLLRFLNSRSDIGRLCLPLSAALLFGAAGGTREPYDALLLAGAALIALVAVWQVRDNIPSKYGKRVMLALSIALFVLPAGVLYSSNSATTSQFPSIGQQFVQSLITNPATSVPAATTITGTTTTTTTQTTVETQTSVVNSTTTTILHTTTTTSTSLVTTTTTTHGQSYPFYARSLLLNTIVIFLGGIFLGWGPIAFLFGALGFAILLSRVAGARRRQDVLVLLIVLTALGSYLIVSFVFAPDPSYFSFQNYSTIIRFSDTALPAYFLVAPIFLAILTKNRKRLLGLAAVAIAILILLVPVYETYAASNFNYTTGNPFQFGYRSDAVVLRDYFATHPVVGPVNVAGLPYGWVFTPGAQDLKSVTIYTLVDIGQAPYLNYTRFLSFHWTRLYIYSATPAAPEQNLPPFLAVPLQNATNSSYPYSVSGSQIAFRTDDFVLLNVTLVWH